MELLLNEARKLGIDLSPEMLEKFVIYKNLLVEWNKKFNLTAITDERGIILKHFVDSLAAESFIKYGAAVIDVGSGAGFPGIPLKIARPDISVTLMDSTIKKVSFLTEAAGVLGLKKISYVHARAEEAGRSEAFREQFDAAVSRAVAPLDILTGYCFPLVKTGGVLLAYKGPGACDEIKKAAGIINKFGGAVDIENVEIDDMKRVIVAVKKMKKTHTL